MPAHTGAHAASERTKIRPLEDRLAAQRFLVTLLAGRPAADEDGLSDARWDTFVEEASRHRLGHIAWRLLSDHHEETAPDRVLERLRTHYVANAFRNAILFRETATATRALSEEGIPVLLLKGIHLARFVYEEPALRSMADIDLMVPRDRIVDADRILVGLGYGPLPRPDIERHCQWSNHLPALVKEGAEVLEVHYDIERPTSPFTIETRTLWEAAQPVDIDGASAFVLSPEHLLINLCLHLAYHHKFERAALKGLVDIATAIRRTTVDWPAFARSANDWKAGPFAYATLRLARDILNAPVPDDVFDELDHGAEEDAVVDVARRYVLTPAVDVTESLVEIQRTHGWPKRLKLFLRGVFPPPHRLRRIYGLEPRSRMVWAFYPVRVIDLLRRRGGLLARVAARTSDVSPVRDRERDRQRIEQWVGYGDARTLARQASA
jgi:hypothetical protein